MKQNKKTVTLENEEYAELKAGMQIGQLQRNERDRNDLLNLDQEIKKQVKIFKKKVRKFHEEDSSDDPMLVFSRRIEDGDPFTSKYGQHGLLIPPFDFAQIFKYFEESDVLQSCVDAMVRNVIGFGFHPQFNRDDLTEKETPEAKEEKQRMLDFFGQVNEDETWMAAHKKLRRDYEITGNSCEEIIRNKFGEILLTYHVPITRMRMTRTGRAIKIKVPIRRNGKEVIVTLNKRFRRFAQNASGDNRQISLRWFKEFGDPRVMNARTGEFLKEGEKKPRGFLEASEIIWNKQVFGDLAYGIPRWIGAILDVVGRRQAGVVNFDLFQNQGLPPLAIMTNGILTGPSIKALQQMIRSARGVDNWNKILLLEVANESMGLDEKGSAKSKIELKNLTEFRKEDLMFDKYLTSTARTIRQSFRMPDLYVGGGSEISLTFAAAKAAQTIVEEQVFIPERTDIEEQVDLRILKQELKITMWSFKLNGPQLVGGEDITKGVEAFSKAGALSVNHSIRLANRLFGTEMSEFENEDWANFPVIMVIKLIELGQLKGLDKIKEAVANKDMRIPKQIADGLENKDNGKQSKEEVDGEVTAENK